MSIPLNYIFNRLKRRIIIAYIHVVYVYVNEEQVMWTEVTI